MNNDNTTTIFIVHEFTTADGPGETVTRAFDVREDAERYAAGLYYGGRVRPVYLVTRDRV